MIHLAATLFFTAALLAACVAIHLTVQFNWQDIVRALRGELGVREAARPSPAYAAAKQPRRAAA